MCVCVCVCVCLSAPARLYGQTVFTECVCVSVPARLYGQTVFTESVHRQCFPEFHITHGAQGSLPWCILDLGPNNIPVCAGF